MLQTLFTLAAALAPITGAFDSEPDANVASCVSARSGDFFTSEQDIIIPAYEPITINRVYLSSGHIDQKNIWTIMPERYLHVENNILYVNDPSGAVIPLKPTGAQTYAVAEALLPDSWTNTASGEPSARTNSRNYKAFRHTPNRFEITAPDGTRRYYNVAWKYTNANGKNIHTQSIFYLAETYLPNGNRIQYTYDPSVTSMEHSQQLPEDGVDTNFFPTTITTTNPSASLTYARLTFAWDKHTLTYKGSDGQIGTYTSHQRRIDRNGQRATVAVFDGFYNSNGKAEKLHYTPHTPQQKFLLQQRRLEDDRGINITYYKPNTKHKSFDGGMIQTEATDDRSYRVHQLYEFVGPSNTPIPTHHFNYHIPHKDTDHDPLTIVTLADKSHLHFSFMKKGELLHQKTHYTSDNTPLYKTTYKWSHLGNLERKTTFGPSGFFRSTNYSYGNDYSIIKRIDIGNHTGTSPHETYLTTYKIDPRQHHLPLTITEENGTKTSYTYKKNTNLPTSITRTKNSTLLAKDTLTYNEDNVLVKHHAFPEQKTTLYELTTSAPYNFPCTEKTYYNNIYAGKTTYTYNTQCHITSETHYDHTDTPLYTLTYQYDKRGNCIRSTDPLGRITTRSYNLANQLTKETTTHTTINTYDRAGRCIETTRLAKNLPPQTTTQTYNARSHLIKETDTLGNTTTYTRDPLGRPLTITHPETGTTTHIYDIHPTPITTTNKRTTQTAYTSNNTPHHQIHADGTTTTYHYAKDGHLLTTTHPKYTKTYTYDDADNLTSIIYHTPDGTHLKTEFTRTYTNNLLTHETDEKGKHTTYTYDYKNRLKTKTHKTYTITYEYDPLDNPITETHTLANKHLYTIHKTYDLANRLLTYSQADATTTYTYDDADNLLTLTDDQGTTSHTYDAFNRLTSTTTPTGDTTTYHYEESIPYKELSCLRKTTITPTGTRHRETYSPSHTLLKTETFDNTGKHLRTTTYTYDTEGTLLNETTTAEKTHTVDYTYDERGNLITKTNTYDNTTHITTYTYNKYNERITETKPSGVTLTYTYDDLGRQTSITSSDKTVSHTKTYDKHDNLIAFDTITRTYDCHGNILTETTPTHTITSTYDDTSNRLTLQTPNTYTTYTYINGRIHTITTNGETHTYHYTKDLITQETDIQNNTYIHTYDPASRRLTTTHPHYTETITYNPEGNVTSHNNNTFTYDTFHQLLTYNTQTYTYNALHEPTDYQPTFDTDGRRQGYTYDALNRLISSPSATYTYDALHRFTTHYYDGLTDIGSPTDHRTLGPTGTIQINDTPAYTDAMGNIAYYHTQIHYSPFGSTTSTAPYLYQSKRLIDNLYHFGIRAYDPQTHQWLTPDPLDNLDAPYLYQFLHNNPFRYTDPTGTVMGNRDAMNNSLHELGHNIMDFASNPHVQGTMQAFGGAAEIGAGATLSFGTFSPVGMPFMLHGADQFSTGLCTAFTGNPHTTHTHSTLTSIGVSEKAARMIDTTISFITPGAFVFRYAANASRMSRLSSPTKMLNKSPSMRVVSRGAENINASIALRTKLSRLQNAEISAARVHSLPDGRIRYYNAEISASRIGPTRGASFVTEWDPKRGNVRTWIENYNNSNQIIRVHPKMLNGQILKSPHYPPIGTEIGGK